MTRDLLLELGLEEIPARFIPDASEQLGKLVSQWLDENRIAYGQVKVFATPRRLAVLINDVGERQQDVREEVKGPAAKIAQDSEGNWSKAALGFARSQGVEPEDLFFRELKGVDYVYAIKSAKGLDTAILLPDGFLKVLSAMVFPKNMRWGDYDFKFVRPIRWIVALFGSEIIPMEITGVHSGRVTQGHRFLGQETEVDHPASYITLLKRQSVYVEPRERKELITEQIAMLADQRLWTVPIDDELLEEIVYLVEYPQVLFGSFDEEYLQIPQQVLITSMREHQRYFPVMNEENELLPYFITVRNGNDRSLELVSRGNEKVLRARLADARFFYMEDQKLSIEQAMKRLNAVVFHEELGSIGDKVQRVGQIAKQLSTELDLDPAQATAIERTAAICKFDLVTQMVYEFPELQGVMGRDYALKAGENKLVAEAINEHYQPRFAGDAVPASIEGAVVSMADKIDTLTACFSIGIIPTGSQDPYALRRQAAGIAQILIEHRFAISFGQLLEIALDVLDKQALLKQPVEQTRDDILQFFALRVKGILSNQVRYDLVDAVMASGFDPAPSAIRRADALSKFVSIASNKTVNESFNRVMNLSSKADDVSATVDPLRFEDSVEHELYQKWLEVHREYEIKMKAEEEGQALELLGELESFITSYFEKVMVMVEDERIQSNRLALLSAIAKDFLEFADFRKLVW